MVCITERDENEQGHPTFSFETRDGVVLWTTFKMHYPHGAVFCLNPLRQLGFFGNLGLESSRASVEEIVAACDVTRILVNQN